MTDSAPALATFTESIDFAALLKRCMGCVELMARILSRFRVVLTQEIDLLTTALEQSDHATILACSHRLKGTCLTASANSLAQLADQLHRSSVTRLSGNAREWQSALEAELANLLASVTDWELGAHRESS